MNRKKVVKAPSVSLVIRNLLYLKSISFSLWISSVNVIKSAGNCELVIFTEEIRNGKLHFLGSE